MSILKKTGGLMVAAAVLVLLAKGSSGCGNDTTAGGGGGGGGGGTGAQVSTDAAANLALITNFIAQGTVDGEWTNTNFGSTGDINVVPTFDAATSMLTLVIDIDGNVFGGTDPDPETFLIDMTDFIANGTDTFAVTSDTYGDIAGTLTFLDDSTGTFSGTATNIPGVTNASVSGSFSVSGSTVAFQQDAASFTFGADTITVNSTFP